MPGISELSASLEAHLLQKLLPFWMDNRDPLYGGWYGLVDEHLILHPEADKGCILNSRILWTFSTAARLTGSSRYADCARAAYDFHARFEDPVHGGVYWSVTRDGKPADTTKHTYCQAFAIYGLSAYYRLTGSQEALDRAFALFDLIETRCIDGYTYGEAYRADFSPQSNEKLSENGVLAAHTMNTLLHVLEAYTELYRACPRENVLMAARRCLSLFTGRVWNPVSRRLEVFFDGDGTPLIDMQSYGHDIEASWLIWDAAQALLPACELAPLRKMCLDLAASVYERALTENGVINECVKGANEESRVWWVQCESVLGFVNAYQLTGEARYLAAACGVWDYAARALVDTRPHGEWHWSCDAKGQPIPGWPVLGAWKCPYHNGRMCLKALENFEKKWSLKP